MAYFAESGEVIDLILHAREQIVDGRKIVARSRQLVKDSRRLCESAETSRYDIQKRGGEATARAHSAICPASVTFGSVKRFK